MLRPRKEKRNSMLTESEKVLQDRITIVKNEQAHIPLYLVRLYIVKELHGILVFNN